MEQPEPQASAAPAAASDAELSESGFPITQIGADGELTPDWWTESTDGQCSENAALFAQSQPGPLAVV